MYRHSKLTAAVHSRIDDSAFFTHFRVNNFDITGIGTNDPRLFVCFFAMQRTIILAAVRFFSDVYITHIA